MKKEELKTRIRKVREAGDTARTVSTAAKKIYTNRGKIVRAGQSLAKLVRFQLEKMRKKA